MIIEEVEDVSSAAVTEQGVCDVGLPHLIWQLGSESSVAGLRALVRGGRDPASVLKHPVDRGLRRDLETFLLQVPGDGLCTVFAACSHQLITQVDDPFPDCFTGGDRPAVRGGTARLHAARPECSIAGNELIDPLPGDT